MPASAEKTPALSEPTYQIGFWYGSYYLGEARVSAPHGYDPIQEARIKLAEHIDFLDRGVEREGKLARLYSPNCHPKIYYSPID